MTQASQKQRFVGTVISDKMDKTVVVKVDTTKRHSKYKKTYHVSLKFKAHDENNEYKNGDKVLIEAIRPMSREKKFTVVGKAK
jgi:small subunit ribosomal protein S17